MKKRNNKLLILIGIILIIITIFILKVNATEQEKEVISYKTMSKENVESAIQEVANAYYNKGTNAQYCSWRKSYVHSPEDATSQNISYFVCSDFTYSVYNETFGIKIPYITKAIISYAEKYYDKDDIMTNDVIEYLEKSDNGEFTYTYKDKDGTDKNVTVQSVGTTKVENAKTEEQKKEEEENRQLYFDGILNKLQVGDVLSYLRANGTGHTLMVYDIIYDDDKVTPIDAIIRESTSNYNTYETKATKISKGLTYGEFLNENNNIYEGTFRELYFKNDYKCSDQETREPLINKLKLYNVKYFAILRPLLRNENGDYTGEYWDVKITGNATAGYTCIRPENTSPCGITDTTVARRKYSGIDIEKTVNAFNNSVVELGSELEYTIKITNKGKNAYDKFEVIENISEHTEIADYGNGTYNSNTITWKIEGLEANNSIEIKYKIKVKNDESVLEKEIISTGTVAGIPSATVKNYIGKNLNNDKKATISSRIQAEIGKENKESGAGFISAIYNQIFDQTIDIEDLGFGTTIKDNNLVIARERPGFVAELPIFLNNDNEFYNMVLSNYYGGLFNNEESVELKYWENTNPRYWENSRTIDPENMEKTIEYKTTKRSERVDTIYKESLQTGDILVYQNNQVEQNGKQYRTEDGTYYLIYIEEKDKITINGKEFYGFVGIDDDGTLNTIAADKDSLLTLLGIKNDEELQNFLNGNVEKEKQVNYITSDRASLQTLLGKDYYVILRPSMVLETEIEISSEEYKIEEEYIFNINANTSVKEFINHISTNGSNVFVYCLQNEEMIEKNEEEIIGTGLKLRIQIEDEYEDFVLIVTGDTDGNGNIDFKDLVNINRHRLNKSHLTDEYLLAGDMNEDGKVDFKDMVKVNQVRLNKNIEN